MRFDTHSHSSRPQVAASLHDAPAYLPVLLVLTGLLLTWHHVGMHRTVELSAHTFIAASDASDGGGASTVKMRRVGDALELACELIKKAEWPYCKLRFEISADGHGLDLSGFDSVSIDANYAGPGPRKAKLFLVNFDHTWSKLDKWETHKVNEVEAFDIPDGKPAELPLHIFYAANWWKQVAKPPLHMSGLQVDNVIAVDFVTEAAASTGH